MAERAQELGLFVLLGFLTVFSMVQGLHAQAPQHSKPALNVVTLDVTGMT